jgi:hypothetical protein
MVVHNLHIFGPGGCPFETDAPLVVDANGMLPSTIPLQSLQVVSGWRPKVIQLDGIINRPQPPFRPGYQIWRKSLGGPASRYLLDRLAFE